jgi:ABC-2 type transport system ATP-binding protein
MKAIEITGLSKTFKKGNAAVEAVKNLSLAIERGEVFGFLGPNGAGKSTTIKMLMGLIRPTEGKIFIMGNEASSRLSRKHIGYLPENPAFYDFLSGHEYLMFVGAAFEMSGSVLREKVERVLRQMELWVARDRPLRGYSKGMVQRLGLAQVLIHDPDVYILDEPMSGLDPLGRSLVKEIIRDLKSKGRSVFFSTHITSDVEAVCDRVGIILQGTLCQLERVDSIMSEGVIGYQIRIRNRTSEIPADLYLPKDEFPKFMKEAVNDNVEIIFIEPKRKDLEAFFLDIVKGTTC